MGHAGADHYSLLTDRFACHHSTLLIHAAVSQHERTNGLRHDFSVEEARYDRSAAGVVGCGGAWRLAVAKIGKKTPMFARFSIVAEERGARRWQTTLDLVSRVRPFHEFPRADVGSGQTETVDRTADLDVTAIPHMSRTSPLPIPH